MTKKMKKTTLRLAAALTAGTLMLGLVACSSDAEGTDAGSSGSGDSNSSASQSTFTADNIRDASEAEVIADREGAAAAAFEVLNQFDPQTATKKMLKIASMGTGAEHEEEIRELLNAAYNTDLEYYHGPGKFESVSGQYDDVAFEYAMDNVDFDAKLDAYFNRIMSDQTTSKGVSRVAVDAVGLGFDNSATDPMVARYAKESQISADIDTNLALGPYAYSISDNGRYTLDWAIDFARETLSKGGYTELEIETSVSNLSVGPCYDDASTSCGLLFDGNPVGDKAYELIAELES